MKFRQRREDQPSFFFPPTAPRHLIVPIGISLCALFLSPLPIVAPLLSLAPRWQRRRRGLRNGEASENLERRYSPPLVPLEMMIRASSNRSNASSLSFPSMLAGIFSFLSFLGLTLLCFIS